MRRWFLSYNSQDLALMQGLECLARMALHVRERCIEHAIVLGDRPNEPRRRCSCARLRMCRDGLAMTGPEIRTMR